MNSRGRYRSDSNCALQVSAAGELRYVPRENQARPLRPLACVPYYSDGGLRALGKGKEVQAEGHNCM